MIIEGRKSKKILDDDEVIRLYLESHDAQYFDELFQRYSIKVYAKCLSLLKNEELANDAVQEIFVKIYLSIAKFSGKSKFSTWLYSITYNYCIDYLRKKKRSDKLFVHTEKQLPDLEADEVNDKELLEMEVGRLKIVLDQLSEKDKSVLLMKYQDGMSIKDIAVVFSKTESAIKMMIKRAKVKAVKTYKELFPHE